MDTKYMKPDVAARVRSAMIDAGNVLCEESEAVGNMIADGKLSDVWITMTIYSDGRSSFCVEKNYARPGDDAKE